MSASGAVVEGKRRNEIGVKGASGVVQGQRLSWCGRKSRHPLTPDTFQKFRYYCCASRSRAGPHAAMPGATGMRICEPY
jgi:hypothetical protein